jgi:ribose/xylose/arabinose/galactoside ABC-type transport system permease subunit/ABC-type sugar transport system substrate-binding protein
MGAALAAPTLGAALRPRTIALLFDNLISPFWLASIERLSAQAGHRGWSVLEAVSNADDNKQYQQVESMIERGVDGIVMVHTDDKAVIPAIRLANRAGVPLIDFNRPPAPSDAYSVAVVADNRVLMRDTVKTLLGIAHRLGGHYQAAILMGNLADANGVNRRDGFQDAIGREEGLVEVVARIATEWNADKAFAGLVNALEAHPDMNMLVTSSDFLTPQIEQALRAAGKWHPAGEPGHVLIAGFDGDEGGYARLAEGYFDVDGVQDLDYEVNLTLESLEQMWSGQKPSKILTDPGFIITRENLREQRDRMWGYQVWAAHQVGSVSAPCLPGAAPVASGPVPACTPVGVPALPGPAVTGSQGWTWVALGAALWTTVHLLFSYRSARDVLIAVLPLAILVVGQTLVMLVGQIDLSLTAILALGSVSGAAVMTHNSSMLGDFWTSTVGVLTSVIVGVLVGTFNGMCTAYLRMPSFIVTLAVTILGSGAAVWYASTVSDTVSIGGLPAPYRALGYGTLMGVPTALLVAVLVVGLAWYLLSKTLGGRWIYAIGHNARAARIAGIPVQRVTLLVFAISGLCAGLSSVIYTSRIEAGVPTLGQNLLLDIVAAAVIGGVSLYGGRGSVLMAALGAVFLGVLDKALQLLGCTLFIVLGLKGAAILVACMLDARRRRAEAS